jgi:hypothetical protein
MPSFTAEKALLRPAQSYRTSTLNAVQPGVVPQRWTFTLGVPGFGCLVHEYSGSMDFYCWPLTAVLV